MMTPTEQGRLRWVWRHIEIRRAQLAAKSEVIEREHRDLERERQRLLAKHGAELAALGLVEVAECG